MDASALEARIALGEDSGRQFKVDVRNPASLGAEMAAFANGEGGEILVGVADDGTAPGLSPDDARRINQMIGNAAGRCVRSPLTVRTENVRLANGRIVIVITVPRGLDRPYFDRDGIIWLKVGADKRKVNSREELLRLFQMGGRIHADELPTTAKPDRLDGGLFRDFLQAAFGTEPPTGRRDLLQLLQNLNLATADGFLNLAGVLLFAEHPERITPAFVIKAIRYPGHEIHADTYLDTEDFRGPLRRMFDDAHAFIMRNLHKIQAGRDVNAPGTPEIPSAVFEELLVNALAHRDYTISAPIRLFIYDDRIEITSPGHLPDNLTVRNIRAGIAGIRNPILASCIARGMLPYRGLGSGIRRALSCWPDIDFIDDDDGNQFTAIIRRQSATAAHADGARQQHPAPDADGTPAGSTMPGIDAPNGAELHQTAPMCTNHCTEKGAVAPIFAPNSARLHQNTGHCTNDPLVQPCTNQDAGASMDEAILGLMRGTPGITLDRLAAALGISRRNVAARTARLKAEGRLRREGPSRNGRWKVAD